MKNIVLRKMIISAMLLSIGVVFHTVIPGILFGMKPDFILAFMFLAFIINPKYSNAFIIGVAGGFLSGLTTSLPGGFLPNLFDKIITMNLIFVIVYLANKLYKKNNDNFDPNYIIAPIIGLIGTIISGTFFLTFAIMFGALPSAVFKELFITIVIPTTFLDIILTTCLYYIMKMALIRSNNIIYE